MPCGVAGFDRMAGPTVRHPISGLCSPVVERRHGCGSDRSTTLRRIDPPYGGSTTLRRIDPPYGGSTTLRRIDHLAPDRPPCVGSTTLRRIDHLASDRPPCGDDRRSGREEVVFLGDGSSAPPTFVRPGRRGFPSFAVRGCPTGWIIGGMRDCGGGGGGGFEGEGEGRRRGGGGPGATGRSR